MRSLADSIQAVADAMMQSDVPHDTAQAEVAEPPKPTKKVTIEEVRAVLVPLTQKGLGAEIRAIFQKYGAGKLSEVKPEDYEAVIAESQYDCDEMDGYTDAYVQFVVEAISEAKQNCSDPTVLIEQKLDFSCYVPDGFGTGDCLIVADKNLHIIDFKYGMGVLVDATENPQMMLYTSLSARMVG